MNITGKIYGISSIQTISTKSGTTIQKREIILDTTRFDPYTGERSEFENYPMFEFNGEKCKDLDGFKAGDVATIYFDLQGGFYDAADGTKKNFTKVRGYKIEARASVQAQPQQQVQPQAAPQPQYQQPPMPSDYPPPPPEQQLPW